MLKRPPPELFVTAVCLPSHRLCTWRRSSEVFSIARRRFQEAGRSSTHAHRSVSELASSTLLWGAT